MASSVSPPLPGAPPPAGRPPTPEPPPGRDSLLERFVDLQVRKPYLPLAAALVLFLLAGALAFRLTILPGFENLLPESRPSVRELRRVAAKTAGVSNVFIVLEGGPDTPTAALRAAADALVSPLEALGPPWVGSVEDGVHDAYRFLAPRAGLFADLEGLTALRDDVEARYAYEVAKATDTLVDDDPPPEIGPDLLKRRLGIEDGELARYPGGYYQSADGKAVVVVVRSKVLATDFGQGSEALRRIRAVVEANNPAAIHPRIRYGLSGDLQTGISEYAAIDQDLTEVGYLGALLIAGIVLLYYLRLRALLAMVLTVGFGVALTFGVTELAIGHLNLATGFLFSIVAGNGINFGIIYMARYLEARRAGRALLDAIRISHRDTWLPTLTAGCAASAAYGSLLVTEFRGFRDFGLIGGAGMVLCWLATYWVLPPILVLSERLAPLDTRAAGLLGRIQRLTEGGVAFGAPFSWLVPRAPRLIALGGVGAALLGLTLGLLYLRSDPMEYDLRKLRQDMSARVEEQRLSRLATEVTGHVAADGMAILVERSDQVEPLRAALRARRDAAAEGAKPFLEVHALQDFVPARQAEKIAIIGELRDRLLRAKKRGLIPEADWERIREFVPQDDLAPFGLEDLPASIARPFTESDGTRGRVLYISPISAESVHDAHYLFRWADAYRETRLPDGSVVIGSGRAVIYADMWAAVIADVPRAVAVSLLATIAVVLLAFRAGRAALAVLVSLLVGIAWMVGLLALMEVKVNFLNFIALPLTFGIGVDYSVNIVQRYVREGAGGALTAVRQTGGAVILCSLTTALGYVALAGSMNHAVRSLGIAAVIGELTCLVAAVLVLPAALVWLDRRRRRTPPP